jgi:type I restriction enzyme R subunit
VRGCVRALGVVLGSEGFFDLVSAERIARYTAALELFVGLRRSVQQRYAETVDYSAYEQQVRKLMDAHIQALEVTVLTTQVNIFDVDAFKTEVDRVKGTAAKADTIASRVQRTITERMDEDPVMFKRFATLVQDAIDDYRTGRIDAAEYFKRIQGYQDAIVRGYEEGIPEPLRGRQTAQAFFGVLGEILERYPQHDAATRAALAVAMAVAIDDIVTARSIRDWMYNADVYQQMTDAIDDHLFEVRDCADLALEAADMDAIIERCLDIARKRAER